MFALQTGRTCKKDLKDLKEIKEIVFLQSKVLSTEGRVVGLGWGKLSPEGPEGPKLVCKMLSLQSFLRKGVPLGCVGPN